MAEVAATAVVDKTAELGAGVIIGPGCVVDAGVVIGDGCELKANVVIYEGVKIGKNNRLFANVVLGEEPQVRGVSDQGGQLNIGDGNVLRENVTIHRGWTGGRGRTVMGSENYLMAGSHVGHDCQIEDQVLISNNTLLSGHCKVERNVWLSALCGVHQFVTIGCYSFIGGLSGVVSDVPPFVRAAGSYPCEVRGLNLVGLRRCGFSEESLRLLDKAFRMLFRRREGKPVASILAELAKEDVPDENVRYLVESMQRGCQQKNGRYLEQFRD